MNNNASKDNDATFTNVIHLGKSLIVEYKLQLYRHIKPFYYLYLSGQLYNRVNFVQNKIVCKNVFICF